MKGKNIIVTGGAGFIGSHIAEALAPGNSVKIIDNLYTGLKSNIGSVKEFEFCNADITDRERIAKELREIDIVFHEGANVRIPDSIKNPQFDATVNIIGTLNVLEASRINDIQNVVFAASTSVYGDPVELPMTEGHPLNPKSPYAVGKRACEDYMKIYNELYGIKTVCLRYFNVYGPRQRADSPYSGVISIFADRLKNGKEVIVYGDGEQSRDFVNVKDVVTANILAAGSGRSGIYNVGSGTEITLNGLIKMMAGILKLKPEVVYRKKRQGDVRRSLADLTKIKKELGFEPEIRLEEGLREVLL
ncbi:MAG: GDP-mannose 4,6-dehydratase [Candidatus Aenigmarchaeota archaeon]|nr:GDP-mannose 4,6-dehydratase [Candidatus Aenigmarchaeota archaeon]